MKIPRPSVRNGVARSGRSPPTNRSALRTRWSGRSKRRVSDARTYASIRLLNVRSPVARSGLIRPCIRVRPRTRWPRTQVARVDLGTPKYTAASPIPYIGSSRGSFPRYRLTTFPMPHTYRHGEAEATTEQTGDLLDPSPQNDRCFCAPWRYGTARGRRLRPRPHADREVE